MEKHKELENKGMSRRRFLSVMAGAGVVGAAATMTVALLSVIQAVQAGYPISTGMQVRCLHR